MRILHIQLSPFQYESRVIKQCIASFERWEGSDIGFAGIRNPEQSVEEISVDGINVWRADLKSRTLPRNVAVQALKYIEWVIRIVRRYRGSDLDIVHGHGLPSLLPTLLVRGRSDTAVLYDAHELESRKSSLRGIRRRIAAWAEHRFIRRADAVVVVSDLIADWYASEYGIDRPLVVRNVPAGRPSVGKIPAFDTFRRRFNIPDGDVIFLYQGALSRQRAVLRFIDVFRRADAGRHMVFMGFGPLEDAVRTAARECTNIHYMPAVAPGEVLQCTVGADVGVCGMGDRSLSYRYSLPNKFFEYLMAGLPVLIGDRPEQAQFLNRYECGWQVDGDDSDFVKLVNSIDTAAVGRRAEGAREAAGSLSWQKEVGALLKAYEQITAERVRVPLDR